MPTARTTTDTSSSKRSLSLPSWFVLGFKVVFSGGLLWLLFSRIDIGRFWTVARQSSLLWLAVALLSYLIAVLVSTWRWHLLLRIQNVKMTFPAVAESFVVALFFNNFLPTNIGGDVMRIRDTAGPAGSSARATTVVVADRIVGLIGLVLVGAFGGAVSARSDLPFSVVWIWVGLAAAVAATIALLLIANGIDRQLRLLALLKGRWIGAQIEALTGSLINFRAAPAGLVGSLALSVLVQAENIAFYTAVGRALGVRVGLMDMALIVPLSALIQVIPVSINGLGLREAAFTILFARIGIPAESALLVSLEATALIMASSLTGAVAYVVRRQSPVSEPATSVGAIAIVSRQL